MKEEIIKKLLEEKRNFESFLRHAIQNEYNPNADNGSERVKKLREELERIWKEIKEINNPPPPLGEKDL